MVLLGSHPGKTKTLMNRAKSAVVATAFAVLQLVPALSVLAPVKVSAATTAPTPSTNPSLSQSCGLDIALVIDNSTSISNTELNQMKNAMTAFTNALNGTPTQFSVTRFATNATVIRTFTSNISSVNSAINGIPDDGGTTNWEDGLTKAGSTLPNRSNPDLVIFASDGNPTISSAGGFNGDQPNEHLAPAITKANAIKATGARILAIGIGNQLSTDNLKAISGPNVNTGNVLTSDVITSDFSTLASDLATFAAQTCGGTITSKKIIDLDGNLNTTGDQTPAEGWSFDVSGTPSNPAPEVTGVSGQTAAVKVQSGTYNVAETPQNGYSLVWAGCTGATNNGAQQGTSVVGIGVANNSIVSCVFINTPAKGQVQVQKKLDLDGDGVYESGNSEAQAHNMFWQLDGGSNTTFGGQQTNVSVGSHQVTESNVSGYHFTGWYPTANAAQQSCSNPAGTTLPVNVNVASGLTTNITLCNQRDTGELKVIKKVINNNGGTKDSSDFTIHVKNGGSDVTGSPKAGSSTGDSYKLATGSYTVSEDTLAGYEQTSLVCKDDTTSATVANPVVLSANQKVTCTITNDDKTPTVTVIKNVLNPYGAPLSPTAFPLFLDGTSVISGTPYTSFNAGWHEVSETQQPGYTFKSATGDCFQGKDVISLLLSLDTHATCTITNEAIQPKLIVKKVVINDNRGTKEASDFTMVINGNSPSVNNFPGTSYGKSVGLNEGAYSVSETGADGYTASYSEDCSGSIKVGETKTCTITNNDIPHPSISVEKYGPDTAYEGDTVWYNFWVTNTGDTQLTNVHVADDLANDETCNTTTLNPGESTWCWAWYEIPSPQVANVVNTVVATGSSVSTQSDVTATDNHTLDVLHPAIKVVKSGPATALAGDTVTYTFTVTNTGDVALENIVAKDSIAGDGTYRSGDTNMNDQLDLTETWIFTADYKIPAGQTKPVVNTVNVCSYQSRQEEEDDDVVLDSLDIRSSIIIDEDRTSACASDSHTLTIGQILPASASTTLAVTGQAVSRALLIALFITSAMATAAVVSRTQKSKEQ